MRRCCCPASGPSRSTPGSDRRTLASPADTRPGCAPKVPLATNPTARLRRPSPLRESSRTCPFAVIVGQVAIHRVNVVDVVRGFALRRVFDEYGGTLNAEVGALTVVSGPRPREVRPIDTALHLGELRVRRFVAEDADPF